MKQVEQRDSFPFLQLALVLAALVGMIELWWLQGPLERDQSLYFVIAQQLLKGRALYSDLWDHKPPAIHFAYAASQYLAGDRPLSLWLLSVLLSVFSGLGLLYILWIVTKNKISAIVALVFWAILSVSPNFEATQPNTEAFIVCCIIWSIVLLRGDQRKVFFATLLFAFATLFKPVAAVFFVPLSIDLWVAGSRSIREKIGSICLLALSPLVLWSIVAGYFYLTDRWIDFYEAVFIYNRFYAGDISSNIAAIFSLKRIFPLALGAAILPSLFALGALSICRQRVSQLRSLAWIGAILFAIALPGNFYLHYYQLVLPLIIFGFGVALSRFSKRLGYLAIVTSALALLTSELMLIIYPQRHHRNPFYPHSLNVEAAQLGRRLVENIPEHEWVYEWGAQPVLYLSTGRDPRHGALHINWLLEGPVAEKLTKNTLDILQRDPPYYVVISKQFAGAARQSHPLWLWIVGRYRVDSRYSSEGDFVVMIRD